VVSPHGDNTNTLPLTDNQTSTRVGAGDGTIDGLDLDVWELYDAYGHPINNTVSVSGVANTLQPKDAATASGGDRYGWLGAYQRPTAQATGLIQMGARPYNPNTGQFLSTDPIPGGNANTYTYPVDPVNEDDESGLSDWFDEGRRCIDAVGALSCRRARNLLAEVDRVMKFLREQAKWTENHENAARHFVGSIVLTFYEGYDRAKSILRAHETEDPALWDDDNRADWLNNRQGLKRWRWANARLASARSEGKRIQRATNKFIRLWDSRKSRFWCRKARWSDPPVYSHLRRC
ncbi:MAG: RHS repeat-associated core domain-containing protein, partial [Candidatus Nanopelagicales bacterium]|nr:RHS repeat-associated core domain-containing protein [Candidatus Nanopelagicales bacterium]